MFYRVMVILLVLCQTVIADRKTNVDSVRTVVDSLISRMRANALSGSGFDTTLLLSDSIETVARAHFGETDTSIAIAEGFKGMALIHLGRDIAAESTLCRAIRIWQASLGTDCPQQASAMRILGDLYGFQHRDVESENTYRSALRILDESPTHKGVWTSQWMRALLFNNLGCLHATQGRYKEAVELYKHALSLWTAESGVDSRDACNARLNLGEAASDLGDYATAEQHVRYALDVYDRKQSEQTHLASNGDLTRLTLAVICIHLGKEDEAVSLLNRAMAGFEQSYGSMSRGLLPALEVGKVIESALGHWTKAAEYAEQGIQIIERTDSRNAADLSHYVSDLATFLYPQGRLEESAAAFDRADSLRQSFMRRAFSYASERSKLFYIRQFPLIDNSHLSLAVECGERNVISSAFQSVLSGKTAILDALSEEKRVAVCTATPEMALLTNRYAIVCNSIAELAVSRLGNVTLGLGPEASLLYGQKDSLELVLSQQCAGFDSLLRMPAVSVAEVARALPARSVLWEYLRYRPYCFSHPDSSVSPRYLAFTLDTEGHTAISDLGEASAIDSLVAMVDQEMRDGAGVYVGEDERQLESDLANVTSQLATLVLNPLLKTAGGCDHIIVSPDGQLSVLPFEILLLSDSRYAIEQYEFSYVSTGRDLLKFESSFKSEATGAVIVAAPDYELSSTRSFASAPFDIDKEGINRFRGPSDRSDCLSVPFNPLPGSAAEGRSVTDLLGSQLRDRVIFLSGPDASEDSLKHLTHPPKVLHLATHGYFCSKASYSDVSRMTESPLLYSGLALAGGNRTIEDPGNTAKMTEDGILTALEVSGLKLMGTDLVVLGSCRAGMGPVLQGEGVYGLRRAFQLAGARSIIMSMFDVPDMTVRDLMTHFYAEWLSGTTKSKALRNAMLAELKQRRQQRGAAHPLFWGGFVLAGDPN